MTQTSAHTVRLAAPFYGAEGAMLHRYLDTEFVPRFHRQLQQGRLADGLESEWREQDRFSEHDDRLVLRLPLHRTFHLVSCEIVCERLGRPALDPERITSAGFVIRRIGAEGEDAWMLEDGEALGWQPAAGERRDPDLARRLRADGTLARASDPAAYSGEQTHPLHVTTTRDADGKRHTVLYGYVPLGGFHYFHPEPGQSPFQTEAESDVRSALRQHLEWPFGYRDGGGRWREGDERQVHDGWATSAFRGLLGTLVERHHLGERGDDDDSELARIARNVHFYDDRHWPLEPDTFSDHVRGAVESHRALSLYDYLSWAFGQADNPLVAWLAEETSRPLPGRPGNDDLALYVSEADAQELRAALEQSVLDRAGDRAQEIPVPKFGQAAGDVYRIVPFVRHRDDAGCERIAWAQADARSEPFRVAAPFDPEASRPSLIQVPGLKDLRRGLAKGASMITPGDTFSLINSLNLKKGASEDVVGDRPTAPGGIQWICSFSLPVVTLVAMILLMIMISLLNIVFWWLPWVRICLPFPSLKR